MIWYDIISKNKWYFQCLPINIYGEILSFTILWKFVFLFSLLFFPLYFFHMYHLFEGVSHFAKSSRVVDRCSSTTFSA
jgi:hypothetical protein